MIFYEIANLLKIKAVYETENLEKCRQIILIRHQSQKAAAKTIILADSDDVQSIMKHVRKKIL